jgi:hypothetical protein
MHQLPSRHRNVWVQRIRLDGTVLLVMCSSTDAFVLNQDGSLVVFRTLEDTLASHPGAFVSKCVESGRALDIDAVSAWCSLPYPKGVESVDQSYDFWDVIELLIRLESSGLVDSEAVDCFRLAEDASDHIGGANMLFTATIPNLTRDEAQKLQGMFESGIKCLRRALSRTSTC